MENQNNVYRRAKTWRIALATMNSAGGLLFYLLIGSATYIGNVNFGILVAAAGIITGAARIFDAVTDPIIALIVERFNSRFGKIRVFLMIAWALMSFSTIMMCNVGPKLGLTGAAGVVFFIVCYIIYIIGYTFGDVAGNMSGNVLTNDPKQRPTLSVWSTIYCYTVPMIFSTITAAVVLPKYNNIQGTGYFGEYNLLVVGISLIFYILCIIGLSPYDKKEFYENIQEEKHAHPSFKDMVNILKENKELQRFIAAAASDKISQVISSAAVVTTMLYGIWIGSITVSTIIMVIGMLPSIVFAIIGAKYAGKHGNLKTVTSWSRVCIVVNILFAAFLLLAPVNAVAGLFTGGATPLAIAMTIILILFNFANSGTKMVVTIGTAALRNDIIDYELSRTGRYMPAIVGATYTFIDKFVSSLGTVIATVAVGFIGYKTTVPQQGDPLTTGVKVVTLALLVIFPIIGWIITLIAEKKSELTYDSMVEIQKEIADKKNEKLKFGQAQ